MQENMGEAAFRNPSCLPHGAEGWDETVHSLSSSPSALGPHGLVMYTLEAIDGLDFLEKVRQDPERGTLQTLPSGPPVANRR